MEQKNGKFLKTAALMVVITLSAKALGMLRDILLAAHYGTSAEAIAYDTASRLPILIFDFVIGGVVTTSFIPVFNEVMVKKGKKDALEYANQYICSVLALTILICALGLVFAEPLVSLLAPGINADIASLAVSLTRIMFPMIIFTGLAFAFVGILQSFGKFLLPATISLVSNLIMVAYFVFLDGRFGIYGLAFAMLCGWGAQALIQLPSVARTGLRFRPTLSFRSPYLKKSLSMALPILISSWVQPLCNLINTRFASSIEGGRAISAIGYANRLYIIIVGVFTFVATNLLFPYFSKTQASGNSDENKKMTKTSVLSLLLIILPITAGIFVLSKPLISLIYMRNEFGAEDVRMTAQALRYFALGMPFYTVNEIYTKKFFAEQKTVPPMITALVSIVFDLALVAVLAPKLEIVGIAISSSAAVLLNTVLNGIIRRKKGDGVFGAHEVSEVLKMLASSLLMGGAVFWLDSVLSDGFLSFVICVSAGVIIYFLSAFVMREKLVCDFARGLLHRRKAA